MIIPQEYLEEFEKEARGTYYGEVSITLHRKNGRNCYCEIKKRISRLCREEEAEEIINTEGEENESVS